MSHNPKQRLSDSGCYICTPNLVQAKRSEITSIILQELGHPDGNIDDYLGEEVTISMQQQIVSNLEVSARFRKGITIGEFFNLFRPISTE